MLRKSLEIYSICKSTAVIFNGQFNVLCYVHQSFTLLLMTVKPQTKLRCESNSFHILKSDAAKPLMLPKSNSFLLAESFKCLCEVPVAATHLLGSFSLVPRINLNPKLCLSMGVFKE